MARVLKSTKLSKDDEAYLRQKMFDTTMFIDEEYGLLILSIEIWRALNVISRLQNLPMTYIILDLLLLSGH
jgi:hypothetical protein